MRKSEICDYDHNVEILCFKIIENLKKAFDNFNDFEETITIDFFWHFYTGQQWVSMVFGSCCHWLQWLSLVRNHWLNDGMVSIDCYALTGSKMV